MHTHVNVCCTSNKNVYGKVNVCSIHVLLNDKFLSLIILSVFEQNETFVQLFELNFVQMEVHFIYFSLQK